jgi:hypothetical protein
MLLACTWAGLFRKKIFGANATHVWCVGKQAHRALREAKKIFWRLRTSPGFLKRHVRF